MNIKHFEMTKFEELKDELISKTTLNSGITKKQLYHGIKRLQLLRPHVEEASTKASEDIPNIVTDYTNAIELNFQLLAFIEYAESRRFALTDPWQIVTYGTDGPDKRVGFGDIEPNHGERREGFGLDPNHVSEMDTQLTDYGDLFDKLRDMTPSQQVADRLGALQCSMYELENKINNTDEFLEHQHDIREGDGTRGIGRQENTGYILNALDHDNVKTFCNEVKAHLKDCIKEAQAALVFNTAMTENADKSIAEAKASKHSARQALNKINQEELRAKRLLASAKYYSRGGQEQE